jgi:hypothetical protein
MKGANMDNFYKQRFYQVFLGKKEIDGVFYKLTEKTKEEREEYVKRSLVNHDGYNPAIIVRERSK